MGLLTQKKLAFVFPGQGSQAVGMGKKLAQASSAAARLFSLAGAELTGLCFEGPSEELDKTINTQPALYLASAAAFEAVRELARPVVCAGHSAGEYAALYAAGAFDFETGLALIRRRAELMNRCATANPGAMAAVLGLSPERLAEINGTVAGICVNANINSPVQTVVSGEKEALAEAVELYKAAGARRVVPLRVSGAFHSPLMAPAAGEFAPVLAGAAIHATAVPVVANVDAKAETDPDTIKDNLQKQLTGAVRWTESIGTMLEMGVEAFVELGPGSVLAGLIRKTAPGVPVISIGAPGDIEKLQQL